MTRKGLRACGTYPVLLNKAKNTIRFPAGAGDWHFFVVRRGTFGMLERDTEVPMPSRAQN